MSDEQTTLEGVALAKDSEGVVELRAVELDPGAGESKQEEEDLWTPEDTIAPPVNLSTLSRLTKASQIRAVCLDALSRNTVGLGWDISVWPEHEGDVDKDRIKEARHTLDALARRDRRLDRPSFSDLAYAVKHDLEECGNGYIEVSRNKNTGRIDGLYHLPGGLVRRRKKRDGWVMGQNPDLPGSTRSDYYNFGEKVEYSDAGEPQGKLANRRLGWAGNEAIALRHYTSESRDYGLPRDIGLLVEYLAHKYVTEWSSSFFSGSGVPPTILFVQGTEQRDGNRVRFRVDQSVVRRINQAMISEGAPGKRVVVVPVPPGTSVHAEQLSELSDRDITFGDFKKEHRHNVGAAFGLMPIFYGDVDDSGRYTAEVQRELCLEETFDPDQRYIEDKLWTTLMADLGFSEFRVMFKRLAVAGDAAKREAANNGASVGAITVGEWRQLNGMQPLPWDGDPNDPENPNNERFKAGAGGGGDPHQAVDMAAQDTRGLVPGLAGRVSREPPALNVSGANGVAKTHEDGPRHVEEAVDDLAAELSEYGPRDAG